MVNLGTPDEGGGGKEKRDRNLRPDGKPADLMDVVLNPPDGMPMSWTPPPTKHRATPHSDLGNPPVASTQNGTDTDTAMVRSLFVVFFSYAFAAGECDLISHFMGWGWPHGTDIPLAFIGYMLLVTLNFGCLFSIWQWLQPGKFALEAAPQRQAISTDGAPVSPQTEFDDGFGALSTAFGAHAKALQECLAPLIEAARDGSLNAEDAFTVKAMANDWLPEIVANYRALMDDESKNMRLANGKTAEAESLAQLQMLGRTLNDIRERTLADRARRISAQGAFLRARLGQVARPDEAGRPAVR